MLWNQNLVVFILCHQPKMSLLLSLSLSHLRHCLNGIVTIFRISGAKLDTAFFNSADVDLGLDPNILSYRTGSGSRRWYGSLMRKTFQKLYFHACNFFNCTILCCTISWNTYIVKLLRYLTRVLPRPEKVSKEPVYTKFFSANLHRLCVYTSQSLNFAFLLHMCTHRDILAIVYIHAVEGPYLYQ